MTRLPAIILAAFLLPATALAQEIQNWASTIPNPTAYTSAIVTDPSGNVYVGGGNGGTSSFTYTLAKYNASGVQQWVAIGPLGSALYAPLSFPEVAGIGVDRSGNVYITSNAFDGIQTTAYNSAGLQLWTAAITPTLNCIGHAMTVDASGNVYVVGFNPYNGACMTLKYGAGGSLLWSTSYAGLSSGENSTDCVAVDASGNVYTSGEVTSTHIFLMKGFRGMASFKEDTSTDIITTKYNASGTKLWSTTYNTGYQINDYCYGMTLDASGNVYVTGGSSGPGFGGNEVIAYSTTNGARLWLDTPPLNLYNGHIAVDPSGNILTESPITNGFTINKYTSSGVGNWACTYASPTTYKPAGMALDNQGNSYVSGTTGAGSAANYTTVQVTSAGSLGWQATYNGPANGSDVAGDVAVFTPAARLGQITYPEIDVTGTANNATAINTIQYVHHAGILLLGSSPDSVTGNTASFDPTAASNTTAALANYPNPFRGTTTIAYALPQNSHVILQLYDGAGRPIGTLIDEDESAGNHTIPFYAGRLAAGIYQYRIVAQSPQGSFTQTKQMIIE